MIGGSLYLKNTNIHQTNLFINAEEENAEHIEGKKDEKVNEVLETSPDNNNEKPAIGSDPFLIRIIRQISIDDFRSTALATFALQIIPVIIKYIGSNSSKDTKPDQTLTPQLPLAEESTYINEKKPKVKLTYQVLDEGKGETMHIFRQGCFQYKEAGSVEDISFEGSPTELAIKLGPGFEEAMLEAIVGMKSNGRRIIFIPREFLLRKHEVIY
ncbi:hypothetical protein ACFE04_026713 [Oxalis oulophora]